METMTDLIESETTVQKPPAKRRKRRTKAQIARDLKRKAAATPVIPEVKPLPPPKKPEPVVTSPAVLALQSQVVDLVGMRTSARQRLTAAHAEYLAAQAKFQAMQGELQGVETEVQYRIGLIGQLENRGPQAPVLNFPSTETNVGYPMGVPAGISVEPTPAQRGQAPSGDPNDMVNRGHAAALRAAL